MKKAKKLLGFVLSCVLFSCLIFSTKINTIYAEAPEPTLDAGLYVYDLVEINENHEFSIAPDAHPLDRAFVEVGEKFLEFVFVNEMGDITPITADKLKFFYNEDGAKGDPFTNLQCQSAYDNDNPLTYLNIFECGSYIVEAQGYEGYEYYLDCDFPTVGFYSSPEITFDSILTEGYSYGKQDNDNIIYLIVRDIDAFRLDESKSPVFICEHEEDVLSTYYFLESKEYTGNISGASKAYEIKLKSKKDFNLEVIMNFVNGESEPSDYRLETFINYQGADKVDTDGPVYRYFGDDGLDYIGYSGCFITKDAYESGASWYHGQYPDDVFYYVHDTSMQGVVDKLLAIAGTEVAVHDEEEDVDTTVVLENSGYILLNMSYRNASQREIVEKEQYVYAPASVKGIYMMSGTNGYTIPQVIDGKTEFIDVLTFTYTDEAYASGMAFLRDENGNVIDPTEVPEKTVFAEFFGEECEDGYLMRKVVYDEEQDIFVPSSGYYLVDTDSSCVEKYSEWDPGVNTVENKFPNTWPSIHLNASTKVRISGLWRPDAELYIGFYQDEDNTETYAYDRVYTSADVGKVFNVENYFREYGAFDPSTNRVELKTLESKVKIHVVDAVSNTEIIDNYSKGDDKASIVVDEASITDIIPLTDDEKKQVIDGSAVTLSLSLNPITDINDNDEAGALAEKIASDKKDKEEQTIDFIDAKLSYSIGDSVIDKNISQTSEDMIVSIPIDKSEFEYGNLSVYRIHDGESVKLESWYDDETNCLCYKTNLYSVYAIVTTIDSNKVDPNLGDFSNSVTVSIVAIVSAGAFLICRKRKLASR